MNRPQLIVFSRARLEVWPAHTRVIFSDGTQVVAAPERNSDYYATAYRLGFGRDVVAMNRTHDLSHLWLSELLGGASPTLRGVATNTLNEVPQWVRDGEEQMACDFQAYLHGAEPQPSLAPLVMAGFSLPALREHAERMRRATHP